MQPTNDGMRKCGRLDPAEWLGGPGGEKWNETRCGIVLEREILSGMASKLADRHSVCYIRPACVYEWLGALLAAVGPGLCGSGTGSTAKGKRHKILFSFSKQRTSEAANANWNTHSRNILGNGMGIYGDWIYTDTDME